MAKEDLKTHHVVGTPAGMFDEMYRNITSKDNVRLVVDGIEEFDVGKTELRASPVLKTPGREGLIERLDTYGDQLAEAYECI